MSESQRARALASFSKNEKFARRFGPKLLTYSINGFLLVLAVTVLYNAVELAQILGWIPTVQEVKQAVSS